MSASSFPLPSSTLPITAANNAIYAGPVSGGPATAAFRLAQLADIQAWLGAQTANLVFAGPASGAAAVPAFRALVPLDLASGGSSSNFYRGDGTYAVPLGTGVGFLTGLDNALPAANAFNLYFANDTIQWYFSDGSNIRNLTSGNTPKCTISTLGGGMSATGSLYSSIGSNMHPLMTNPYSLVAAIYVNSLPGVVGGVISSYGVTSTNGWYLQNSQVNTNSLALYMQGVNSNAAVQLSSLTLTTGIHVIALNYNGTAIRYCMDGGTVFSAATSGAYVAPTTSSQARIGGFFANNSFPMTWAEFNYIQGYSTALSDADLQAVSAVGSTYRPGVITPAFAYYLHAAWAPVGGGANTAISVAARGSLTDGYSTMFLSGTVGVFCKQR